MPTPVVEIAQVETVLTAIAQHQTMLILLQLALDIQVGVNRAASALLSTRALVILMLNSTTPTDQLMSVCGKLILPTGASAMEVKLHAMLVRILHVLLKCTNGEAIHGSSGPHAVLVDVAQEQRKKL